MTTSGTYTYTEQRNQIIKDALCKLTVISSSEDVSSDDLQLVNRQLNRMIKAWQGNGVRIWKQKEGHIFLNPNQTQYTLVDTAAGSHATDEFVTTELDADAVEGQTLLQVDDTTEYTLGDAIGIQLDSGERQWTTITTINSTTSVTIDTALEGDSASGNTIYSYTDKLRRPLRIFSIRLNSGTTAMPAERPLIMYSRQQYFDIVDKKTNSTPSVYYYDPQRTEGKLYIWPADADCTDVLNITYQLTLEDAGSAGNTLDFPEEWLDAIVMNLAVRVSPDFGYSQSDISNLISQADKAYYEAFSWDQDISDVLMHPTFDENF